MLGPAPGFLPCGVLYAAPALQRLLTMVQATAGTTSPMAAIQEDHARHLVIGGFVG